MKDLPFSTFSSPELQKAVIDVRPILEGVEEARNRVSNDIKALESYLSGLDLKTSFRHGLGKCLVPYDNDGEYATAMALENSGSASGTIQEEALVWEPGTNGKARLLYELNRWDGSVDIDVPGGPYFWDEATLQREAKPLIEAKFEIRQRLYEYLPDFVVSLGKYLSIGKPRTELDEVPF